MARSDRSSQDVTVRSPCPRIRPTAVDGIFAITEGRIVAVVKRIGLEGIGHERLREYADGRTERTGHENGGPWRITIRPHYVLGVRKGGRKPADRAKAKQDN